MNNDERRTKPIVYNSIYNIIPYIRVYVLKALTETAKRNDDWIILINNCILHYIYIYDATVLQSNILLFYFNAKPNQTQNAKNLKIKQNDNDVCEAKAAAQRELQQQQRL